jgi:glycosyltransferase involved in cell wall biosynthesis
MRIGVDVRYLSHGLMGGINTYLRGLLPAMLAGAPEHHFVLYADSKAPFDLPLPLPANATLRTLPYTNGASTAWYDLFLGRQMAHDRLDVAHFPANVGMAPRGVPGILTLHDALTILPVVETLRGAGSRRTLRSQAMTVYLNALSRRSVRAASLVLTVSAQARSDIARHGLIPAERIVAIPHGAPEDAARITDPERLAEVRNRLGLPGRFVLADALKNPAVLVHAWRRLPADLRAGRSLLFFSRRPDPLPTVFEAVEAGEAALLVRPSRADLIALYSMADLFVFPSWFEGFGIPILEAMRCGAPVIASDRYAIPEVVGDAGLLVDAEDVIGLAAALIQVLGDPAEHERLRMAGFVRAHHFTWQRAAAATLAAYERVRAATPFATTADRPRMGGVRATHDPHDADTERVHA